MRVTYTPDDEEKREWQFNGRTLMTTEAEALEKVTGIMWGEFTAKLMQGSPTAKRGLVWVMRKREDPSLRYSDCDFPIGAAEVELEAEEKADLRKAISRSPSLTEEERREALAQLADDDDLVPDDGPKGDLD